jgi:hypothetical protein
MKAHAMNYYKSLRPHENFESRNRARLWVLNEWIAVDQWLDIVETARHLDSRASERGWHSIRRDPWKQIPREHSDDFYLAVGRLHGDLVRQGITPTPAIAAIADVTDQIADLWIYVAEQRGLLDATPAKTPDPILRSVNETKPPQSVTCAGRPDEMR